MSKVSASTASTGVSVDVAGTSARKVSQQAGRASVTKKIDPALRRAVQVQDAKAPLIVMVKLDSKKSAFGKLPVSNRPGSARERTFNQEVNDVVQDASISGKYKVVSMAANLGVATVEISAGVVQGLLKSEKVTGMKLKVVS